MPDTGPPTTAPVAAAYVHISKCRARAVGDRRSADARWRVAAGAFRVPATLVGIVRPAKDRPDRAIVSREWRRHKPDPVGAFARLPGCWWLLQLPYPTGDTGGR